MSPLVQCGTPHTHTHPTASGRLGPQQSAAARHYTDDTIFPYQDTPSLTPASKHHRTSEPRQVNQTRLIGSSAAGCSRYLLWPSGYISGCSGRSSRPGRGSLLTVPCAS